MYVGIYNVVVYKMGACIEKILEFDKYNKINIWGFKSKHPSM